MNNNNNNSANRISIRPVVAAFEHAFDLLNERFYNGLCPVPCITVNEGTTMHAYGWATVAEVWHEGENSACELNISGDYLNRPFADVVTTLMHEMVHLENNRLGVKDTTRRGIRHNKKFAEEAEKHGLVHIKGEDFDKVGFARVYIKEEFKEEILTMLADLEKALTIYRDAPVKDEKKKNKSVVYKYMCPCCGDSVRATKMVSIMCNECGCDFELA